MRGGGSELMVVDVSLITVASSRVVFELTVLSAMMDLGEDLAVGF